MVLPLTEQSHLLRKGAHRTFRWNNEAKGNAAVHVVIIGFASFDTKDKLLYEYNKINGEPLEIKVKNINLYLVEGKDIFIQKRTKPICNVPEINRGSDAIDDGNLLLNEDERLTEYKPPQPLMNLLNNLIHTKAE